MNDYKIDVVRQRNYKLIDRADTLVAHDSIEVACDIYKEIINGVSKYRYHIDCSKQVAFSIDAAKELAEYYEAMNNEKEAKRYYQYIVDRLKYERRILSCDWKYRTALKKLGYDKDYPYNEDKN